MDSIKRSLKSGERWFNPRGAFPDATPSQIIYEDPVTGISYLSFPPGQLDSRSCMRKAVVVTIHGASKDNGDPAAQATYAVWFGKKAGYANDHDVVPARESQKRNAAALYAVKRVIEQAENALALEDPATQRPVPNYVLIIKTHSNYVAKCLSYYIKEWEANESRETVVEAATNGLLFEAVENLIREAAKECRFRVKFWLVGKEFNEEAIALAKDSWHAPAELPAPTENALERTVDYWMQEAHLDPLTRQLCGRLGIHLPQGAKTGPGFTGITAPIQRLVVMGEDTPANFKRLLGPEWQDSRLIGDEWWAHRLAVLQPRRPPTSPLLPLMDVDVRWIRPRLATAADRKRIANEIPSHDPIDHDVSGKLYPAMFVYRRSLVVIDDKVKMKLRNMQCQ